MSYQQKSLWLLLASYAARSPIYLFKHHGTATILVLLAIQVIGQILIRVTGGKEPKDERDNLIEAKSYRTGYLVVFGVIVCMNLPSHAAKVGPFLLILLIAEVSKAVT